MPTQQEIAYQLATLIRAEGIEGKKATDFAARLARADGDRYNETVFSASIVVIYLMSDYGVWHEMSMRESFESGNGASQYGLMTNLDLDRLAAFEQEQIPALDSTKAKEAGTKRPFTVKPLHEVQNHYYPTRGERFKHRRRPKSDT